MVDPITFYDASGGVSDATQGRIGNPSSEGGAKDASSERGGYKLFVVTALCRRVSSQEGKNADNDRDYSRCEAKTASGSVPETLPTAIQPNRLTSEPIKNEIAANGTRPKNRRISASGPFKISPIRISQPEPCSCIARSAAPCLLNVSQIKSADSTAAA